MIRKNLLKTTLLITVIATLLVQAGCGKKTANNITYTKTTVSSEAESNATKELTNTSLVTFNYTDEHGNTYTLEGKAIASETGDATIEVADVNGNKVTFIGKATITDGRILVSNVSVMDEGTLIKADGTEIKVSIGNTVTDAIENTDGNNQSDIVASDDVKKEIETAKHEEKIITVARDEVTRAEINNIDVTHVQTEETSIEHSTENKIEQPTDNDNKFGPTEANTETNTEPNTKPSTQEEDVLILSGDTSLSGKTINNDVYITYSGVVEFDNITINGDIYCYGVLRCSSTIARNVYAYSGYNGMFSCSKSDGVRGVSGDITCNELYIQDDALDYAFSKWGKY